jgi:8-oxo-dGTP pyrophosphatase MutT (NUDIX family)
MTTEHPPVPIPSATIIIGRESSQGFEIFMVVRHQQIDFASGALVFPGGKTEPGDHDPEIRQYCVGAEDLSDEDLATRVAAIRETFEESGILLARQKGDEGIVPGARLRELKNYREKLTTESTNLLDFLRAESLTLAIDHLTLFAHWITPEMMPKRFDTFFYLAEAPEDHLGVHDGSESVDSLWISPQQALAENEAGKHTIIFPTRMNIQKLARNATLSAAITTAKNSPVVSVQPWVENRASGPFLCIPEEADYDITAESLDKIIRDAKSALPG